MQPGAHRSEDNGPSRAGLTRGILVIVTAVAVGAFVLSRGLDDSNVEAVATGGEETQEAATTELTAPTTLADPNDDGSTTVAGGDQSTEEAGDGAATTSTTTNPASPGIRAPADVSVLVLNAAGTKGIAGRGSEVLQAAGYSVLAPKNATRLGPTSVQFTAGFEAEAQAVAEAFGLDPVAVVSAYDPAAPPIDDIRDAIVIVVIGEDGLINV